MLRFSANISMLFKEVPFKDRFAAAKQAGFEAVECWHPYEISIPELKAILDEAAIPLIGINTAAGNPECGDWGLAVSPNLQDRFKSSVDQALSYAVELKVQAIHVMAGIKPKDFDPEAALDLYKRNLIWALDQAQNSGVMLMIEPLNPNDRPDYLLNRTDQASEIIKSIGSDNLGMMFDIYHVQRAEGDVLTRIDRHWSNVCHFQIASVPHRREPGTGELDDHRILREIERRGWGGWIGAEYIPTGSTEAGLGWRNAL